MKRIISNDTEGGRLRTCSHGNHYYGMNEVISNNIKGGRLIINSDRRSYKKS